MAAVRVSNHRVSDMPLKSLCNPKIMRAALAGLAGAMLAIGVGSAPASAQEEDVPIDRKIINTIMGGLGFRRAGTGPSINYHERSPLVIPPSRDLPPPEANATDRNPAWPVDPDLKRRKEATSKASQKTKAGYESIQEEESHPLSPYELERGRVARSGQRNAPGAGGTEPGPLKPWDLGYKGDLFNWKSMFGGGNKNETAKFTGEPSRSELTQPPTGYQTPSPHQPYGLGPVRQTVTPDDRAARDVR